MHPTSRSEPKTGLDYLSAECPPIELLDNDQPLLNLDNNQLTVLSKSKFGRLGHPKILKLELFRTDAFIS